MSYPHETGTYACPCGPQYFVLCPECAEQTATADGKGNDPDCWRCRGDGEVEVSAEEARLAREVDDEFIHVLHRWMAGDPDGGEVMVNTRPGPDRIDSDRLFVDDGRAWESGEEEPPDDDGMADTD